MGQKVNVEYFRVDPYTLGNRIPQVFVPIFFGESLYMWGTVWGTKSMKKFSGYTQEEKKSKKVNKILFPFPFPFLVIPKNGGL